jgi:hypothetical protein
MVLTVLLFKVMLKVVMALTVLMLMVMLKVVLARKLGESSDSSE